jgi:signal transduction histidine kinase
VWLDPPTLTYNGGNDRFAFGSSFPARCVVLNRPLALKLLAPTVLVSVILVGACVFGVMYLNYLHLNVAIDLSENVQSTKVAVRLETTAENLVNLFRKGADDLRHFRDQIAEQNQEALSLLAEAENLANSPREQHLVDQLGAGLHEYLDRWEKSISDADQNGELEPARILRDKVVPACRDLRFFNADQVEKSDRSNSAIVHKLQWALLTVGFGGPLAGLVLGYAVARSLRHSIYQLSVRIRDAAGRLNRELGSVTLEEEGDLSDLHRQMQGVTEEIERVIEQLQQREREVLRAEQLAAVGQVAAGVAHELRNPLTSIKMMVQTALEGEPGSNVPREDLAVIEHEIRRMEQCIQLFLDFARPPDSERRRTDLTAVVRRALALIEGRAHRQKVTLIPHLPIEPVHLRIDAEQVHQVLVNLLLNSLDALPRGGTVHVQVKCPVTDPQTTSAKGQNGHGAVEVRVWDTGSGIAARIRERLFEPFVSSKETGLGLGLSICKRLVEAHGGSIRGENGRDGGAVFAFTMPLEDADRPGE